jgi:hypothetical protein
MSQFFSQRSFEPKRKFRFTVHFSGMGAGGGDLVYMAKSATKPSYTIEGTSHKFLNHEFKFPNIVSWQDVNVSFIDAVDPNVGSRFYDALLNTGYMLPSTLDKFKGGVTKLHAAQSIGQVTIRQLDGGDVTGLASDGVGAVQLNPNVVDEWVLINAWITSLKFGEGLDYTSTDLVTVDLTLKYDFAQYSRGNQPIG